MSVASLPDDVLHEIFERAIPISLETCARTTRKIIIMHEAPLNISHTCRAWRKLVLSFGRFWARILHALQEQYLEVDIRLLSLLLERTAGTIIDIDLHFRNIRRPFEKPGFRVWFRTAARKQSCWGKMTLQYYLHSPDGIKPAKLRNLPNLTELTIYHMFPFGLEACASHPPLFVVPIRQPFNHPIAPLLSRLSLTWLNAKREANRGILAMLRQCPNLTFLRVVYMWEDHHPNDIDEPICVMDKLEELVVEENFKLLFLLRKILAPSLRSLTVDSSRREDAADLRRELPILLSRPRFGAPLLSASVRFNCAVDTEEQLQLLQALSDVKDLSICFKYDEDTFHLLSFDDDGGQLCPYLEKLHIFLQVVRRRNLHSIECMLASRYRRSGTFHAIITAYSWPGREAIMSNPTHGFKLWVEEGRLEVGL